MSTVFGFIGFGEVASVLSEAISEHGGRVVATDVLLSQVGGEAILQERIRSGSAVLVSMNDLVRESDIVLSTVTTMAALQVAEEVASRLRKGQNYVDLNSTSPRVKMKIGVALSLSAATFVEAAVLGAVGATGARTRLLLCGKSANDMANLLNEYGLNATFYSETVGQASTFKMLRSIFSKGLEALILETLVAGRRAGIEESLWGDITSFMASKPFDVIAHNWTKSHGSAYERRYHEMEQVLETMREVGVRPIMSEATAELFRRSVRLNLASRLRSAGDDLAHAVIDALVTGQDLLENEG